MRQTVGCLDIAVLGLRDVSTRNPLLEVNLGNRCDHGVDVDLGALRAQGRTATHVVALTAFDPRQEIRVLRMDGRMAGREVIEYRSTAEVAASSLLEVCIDASGVDASAREPERWTCSALDGAQ